MGRSLRTRQQLAPFQMPSKRTFRRAAEAHLRLIAPRRLHSLEPLNKLLEWNCPPASA